MEHGTMHQAAQVADTEETLPRAQSSQAKGKISTSPSCLLKIRDSLIDAWTLRRSGCMRRWGY